MGTAKLSSLVHLQLQSLANAGVQHRCIQALVEEDRALAAKLQGHRRERPRAARGHVLGDFAAAREDEVVGALVDQAIHSVLVALLDPYVAIQVLLAESAEQGRHVRHQLGRLDRAVVARREHGQHGDYRELDRRIPRRDIDADALRLVHHAPIRLHAGLQKRRARILQLLRNHPRVHQALVIFGAADQHLAHAIEAGGEDAVLLLRSADHVEVLGDHGLHPGQRRAPLLGGLQGSAPGAEPNDGCRA
mmetsp:Transcript_33300/g.84792  ORF Transcript_33300/g.84792 Transcript_33300/m.84792 type:complete len:248 (+) Transcript_33300:702-1445(+)